MSADEILDALAPGATAATAQAETRAGRQLSLRWHSVREQVAQLGHVLIVRDITDQEMAKRDLLGANEALREQLETIERLRSELAEQTLRDSLTGLFNRRRLNSTFAQLDSADRPVSVLVLDLDHFKEINDTYGHTAGDEVLVAVADLLRKTFATAELLARFGGEEFVAVLTETSVEAARADAERFRQRVHDSQLAHRRGWSP